MARESSGSPELPKFSDRLPDLILALKQTGRELARSPASQSFVPYWEDLYARVHSIKGVLKILSCPEPLADFIHGLNDALVLGLSGEAVCRRLREAGAALEKLAALLDAETEKIDVPALQGWLAEFRKLYDRDEPHGARLKRVPPHLYHVNELVTKKAREIELLGLNHCVIEDEILLDEVSLWRAQLNEALTSESGRGLVVNFLPFLSPEGSRYLRVWAWVAAPTHSRAELKQRIKEMLPKAKIGKL